MKAVSMLKIVLRDQSDPGFTSLQEEYFATVISGHGDSTIIKNRGTSGLVDPPLEYLGAHRVAGR
jgi:hypothetical protein